jgi:8-oxo-dGTP diphosphatase
MKSVLFGEKVAGALYVVRPGAYAVIMDERHHVAALRAVGGYYLPGGGLEKGEDSETALHREMEEECQTTIEIIRPIGQAVDYLYATSEMTYFEKQGSFYFCRFIDPPNCSNLDWITPGQLATAFRQQGHAWAALEALKGIE